MLNYPVRQSHELHTCSSTSRALLVIARYAACLARVRASGSRVLGENCKKFLTCVKIPSNSLVIQSRVDTVTNGKWHDWDTANPRPFSNLAKASTKGQTAGSGRATPCSSLSHGPRCPQSHFSTSSQFGMLG